MEKQFEFGRTCLVGDEIAWNLESRCKTSLWVSTLLSSSGGKVTTPRQTETGSHSGYLQVAECEWSAAAPKAWRHSNGGSEVTMLVSDF